VYDYIVVGGGSAGCVLANRLSVDPANRVLLIEAGRDERRKEITIPAAWPKLFRSACDWAYETEPNEGLGGRTLYVPRGKMLGGTSSMNAMLYIRGNRADFDEWAAAGNDGWSYDDVLPYFTRSEDNERGASEYHGAGGPLPVTDVRDPNPLSTAFIEAAVATGVPRNEDINGATQDGVGYLQSHLRRGRRYSMADAFLRPVMGRRNLTVITGAHVARILLDGRRAVGVIYLEAGREHTVRAEREVLVSCGALDSPKLLLLSGIGPADELRRHGIPVVHDLPGVGRNLQEHPAGGIRVTCRQPISLLGAQSLGSVLRYLVQRRGMLARGGPDAVAFVRTRPDLDAPDVELFMMPILWLDEGFTMPTEHGYTLAAIVLKPRSRGRVTLRSAGPLAAPVIDTAHFSDRGDHDARTLIDGIRLVRRIVAAPPLAALSLAESYPGAHVTDEAGLRAALRSDAQTIWHPVGTCKMGVDEMSVVDPSLRVRGIEGLRVADASVMPTIVRGHTLAATVMIAEKGADLILGRSPLSSSAAAHRTSALQVS
jgi:choline dehydrogenase